MIAYIARRISTKDADKRYTFGYRRAEMIGALVNLTLLAVIGLYLVYEGVMRLLEPVEIIGWLMAATAILALVVDVVTALLLWSMSQGSLNVRAAFVHNIVDALGSVAVLLGAGAIIWLNWVWVDSAITLLIAGYVLWQVVKMFPQVARVLMEGTPLEVNLDEVVRQLQQIDDVASVHHLHVWALDEQHRALEAHVVIGEIPAIQIEAVKRKIKKVLHDEFSIHHSTLEFEHATVSDDPCDDQRMIPGH